MKRRAVGDGLSAFAVIGLFGFGAVAIFAIGVWFLLWVIRLVVIVWVGLALALRWTHDLVTADKQ